MKTTQLALIIWLLCKTSVSFAYLENYGPFPHGTRMDVCDITEVTPSDDDITRAEGSLKIFNIPEDETVVRIKLFNDPNRGLVGQIFNPEHQAVTPLFFVGSTITYHHLFWANLNNDDQKDFILTSNSSGAGLAGDTVYVTFVLSAGEQYRLLQTTTYGLTNKAFICMNNQFKFIHTSFVRGEKGLDQKSHNYWVYNLYGFEGNKIVLQNHLNDNFPKWVMYTSKTNHTDTKQLTRDQKNRLWKNHSENLYTVPKGYQK